MLNKSSELLFKEFYRMTKELCNSLGVNIQPKMNCFEMFRAACEKLPTEKLSECFVCIEDRQSEFFEMLREVIFKELQRRGVDPLSGT